MAARVSASDVTTIVQTSLATAAIDTFIDTATQIVNTHLLEEGYTPEILRQIELYLAAHLTTIAEEKGGLVRSSVGDAAETYSDVFGPGFQSTHWGQLAIQLDSNKVLASIGSTKLKAMFEIDVPASDDGSLFRSVW